MARERIESEKVLSGAEKQKRHREKRKAELTRLRAAAQILAEEESRKIESFKRQIEAEKVMEVAAIREQIKSELEKSWEPELKAVRIATERDRGRELAEQADQSFEKGRVTGICEAARFLILRSERDLAKNLLSHCSISQEIATAADDKAYILSKNGAWEKNYR